MNHYFIDTFELTYRGSFDEIRKLTKHMDIFKLKDKNYYICNNLSTMGFMLKSTQCSRAELYNDNKKYKLVIRIDPDKVYHKGIKEKHIYDTYTFEQMIKYLDLLLTYWFKEISLNDFELTRIDITKDIHGIPEPVIQEYIMLMRQMPLSHGFSLKEYQKEPKEYFPENSFEVWHNNSRLEFVVYNKHHEVHSKAKYSDEDKEYYRDTMRMEVRCNRRYYKKLIDGLSTSEALLKIFNKREKIAVDTFYRLFKYYYDCCFIGHYWQKKYISIRETKKPAKIKKMLWLTEKLNDKTRPTPDNVMEAYPYSVDAKINLLCWFEDISLSPIPTQNKDIPFLQSLSSILELSTLGSQEKKYYNSISKRSGKELFLHM